MRMPLAADCVCGAGRGDSQRASREPLDCPDCGMWLYGGPRAGGERPGATRVIRGETLDDTAWLRPATHFWVLQQAALNGTAGRCEAVRDAAEQRISVIFGQ